MARMNMIEAIRSAHDVMMERDPSVVVLGEDVGSENTIEKIVLRYRELLVAIANNPSKQIKDYKNSGQKKSLKRKAGSAKKGTKEG